MVVIAVTVFRFRIPERLHLLEPLAVFGLIMAYIWRFRVVHPWSWTFVLAAVLASHFLRGGRPAAIGCRTQGFIACLRTYGPALALLVAIGFGIALEWGTLRPMTVRAA